MRPGILTSILWPGASAVAYYSMVSYAPSHPEIHGKAINAHNKVFVIGAETPTTFCGLDDTEQCPQANSTLINAEMTCLAVRREPTSPCLPTYLPTYLGIVPSHPD